MDTEDGHMFIKVRSHPLACLYCFADFLIVEPRLLCTDTRKGARERVALETEFTPRTWLQRCHLIDVALHLLRPLLLSLHLATTQTRQVNLNTTPPLLSPLSFRG